MKVVLLQDVTNLGRAGEVKEVADGYGRNFLLPRKLALLATSPALKIAEARLQADKRSQARSDAEVVELAQRLDGMVVSLSARAGAKDRLYGSITTADIAQKLYSISGIEIDKRKIELEEPLRQLGSYQVGIRLAKDVVPKLRVVVEEEKE